MSKWQKKYRNREAALFAILPTWSKGVMGKIEQKVRKFEDRSGAKANALWYISYTNLILLKGSSKPNT